ncbi:MAG: XRE family transcriptional regulator [Boseongicola sp.]|nr:XRE family transcriptional regulator [Boseongicola sp.]MDD9978665.1 XRE family transcriptional regulator [Boseongicola sp.]
MNAFAPPDSLGRDLRALRKSRGLTLVEVAERVDRSVGWMSQVERDLSEPTLEEIETLSEVLDVSVTTLFGQAPARKGEEGIVVRKDARRPVGKRADGLVEELLSPDLTDEFEVVHSMFEPGAKRSDAVTRPTQELAYIVSGCLDVTVEGETFSLTAGDSLRIREQPFRWENKTNEPCIAIWVIAPPVY